MLGETIAVVTGSGRGIGREIAVALSKEGASVVVAARSQEMLEETAERIRSAGGTALVVPTDLREPVAVEELVARTLNEFGQVDTLVNNSGVTGPVAPLWEVDLENWNNTLAVNLTGAYLCCHGFLPSMIERGRGSIVMIGSIIGKESYPRRTPYAASKMALVGLTRSLAAETGPHGIRVNLITPGFVKGERLDRVLGELAAARRTKSEEIRREFESTSPLQQLVDPGDIASAAVFLASPASSAITGIDLNVNAGVVMH